MGISLISHVFPSSFHIRTSRGMRWKKFTFGHFAHRGSSRSTPLRGLVLDSAKFHLSICNLAILYSDQFEQNLIGGEGIVEEEQQQAAG